MKIRILIIELETGARIVERVVEILEEGDLAREVSIAVEDGRKLGIAPYGWSLHVDKA